MLLFLPDLDIPTSAGWKHLETSWFVGMTPDVTPNTSVWKSMNNKTKLTSITCGYDFIPGTTYYYKVRIICNNGIIEANVGVVKVNETVLIAQKYKIPSVVVTPVLTMRNTTDTSLFKVEVSKMSSTSNGELNDVTYLIERLDGEVVYTSLVNNDDLSTKTFDDVILDSGRTYILRVAQKSTSGDVSPFANAVFTVPNMDKINLVTPNRDVYSGGFDVLLSPIDDIDFAEITLTAVGLGTHERVFTRTIKTLNTQIPKESFDYKTNTFLLGIKATLHTGEVIGTKYFELRHR